MYTIEDELNIDASKHVLMFLNLRNYFEMDNKPINEWGWVGYEELSRSRRVL